jgi:hypothetical protein
MAKHERRKGPPLLLKTVTAEALLKVIRRYCLRCSGNSKKQVKVCNIADCPLHPYRNCTALVQIDMTALLSEKKRRT